MPRLTLRPRLLLLTGFIAAACVYIFFLEPWGHDTLFHLQRLQDIELQLDRGQLRAHFGENLAEGKGLAVWVYYSQWVYWPAVALRSIGASPLVSLKIVYCVFLIVCCVGCFRLLRLHNDEETAAFGTILFMTSNYVIGEVFQRSAYAEFLSVALLPLLLFTLHRTVVQGDRRAAAVLVLLASLMILFHPLSFMNAGWALVAYATYIAISWRIPYRRFLRLAPLFALAMGLTAFYWVPAVVEMRYVLGAEGVPTPVHATFLTVVKYLNFTGVNNVGLVLNLCAAAVVCSMALSRTLPHVPGSRISWPLVAGIVVYVFLTLRISEPLYTHIPILASNLWVWRVLFPLTLLVVILVCDNLHALPRRLRSDSVLGALAALAVLQAAVFVLWHTASRLSTERVDLQEIEVALARESRRMEGFGVDEYLPDLQMAPSPADNCPALRSVLPEGRYEWSFEIAADESDACIHIPRYWNVRYAASINGEATPVYANAEAEILIVPAGQHGRLSLHLTEPDYVRVSTLLSGVAAILWLVGVAWSVMPESWNLRSIGASARRLARVSHMSLLTEQWRVLRARKIFWMIPIVLVSLLLVVLLVLARGTTIASWSHILL